MNHTIYMKSSTDNDGLEIILEGTKKGIICVKSCRAVGEDLVSKKLDANMQKRWVAGKPHSTLMYAVAGEFRVAPASTPHCTIQEFFNHLLLEEALPSNGSYFPIDKLYTILRTRQNKTSKYKIDGASARTTWKSVSPYAEVPDEEEDALTPAPVAITKRQEKPEWLADKPDPAEFFVRDDVWEEVCYAMTHGTNLLLTGPSGTGKSELVYYAAEALGKTVETFNMGAMTEPRTALVGAMHLTDKGTEFVESRFVPAIQNENAVVLLDELTRTNRAASNLLLPLLDNQRILSLDEAEKPRIIERHGKNCVIATANIGMEYTGTSALDKAMKDRFSTGLVEMWFPPLEAETTIVEARTGVERLVAKNLCRFASKQRKAAQDDDAYTEYVSTRMLIECGKKIAAGVTPTTAAKHSILSHFDDDGGSNSERAQLAKLLGMNANISVPV